MSLATGEVVPWLNADDVYFPWTLDKIGFFFSEFKGINWITGVTCFLDSEGNLTHFYNNLSARPQKKHPKRCF